MQSMIFCCIIGVYQSVAVWTSTPGLEGAFKRWLKSECFGSQNISINWQAKGIDEEQDGIHCIHTAAMADEDRFVSMSGPLTNRMSAVCEML